LQECTCASTNPWYALTPYSGINSRVLVCSQGWDCRYMHDWCWPKIWPDSLSFLLTTNNTYM